jgi:hypothetical protein
MEFPRCRAIAIANKTLMPSAIAAAGSLRSGEIDSALA